VEIRTTNYCTLSGKLLSRECNSAFEIERSYDSLSINNSSSRPAATIPELPPTLGLLGESPRPGANFLPSANSERYPTFERSGRPPTVAPKHAPIWIDWSANIDLEPTAEPVGDVFPLKRTSTRLGMATSANASA
jgi:hypothetical protein